MESCSITKASQVRSAHKSDSFSGGLRRSAVLFSKFRTQFEDPDDFYTYLAEDTVQLVTRYEPVKGKRVVDIGGGPGYFAKAFLRSGAASCFVEPFWDEMTDAGRSSGLGIVGDGMDLPFADNTFDISHSSNVIEHVLLPKKFFDEMIRVVRPGGSSSWRLRIGYHHSAGMRLRHGITSVASGLPDDTSGSSATLRKIAMGSVCTGWILPKFSHGRAVRRGLSSSTCFPGTTLIGPGESCKFPVFGKSPLGTSYSSSVADSTSVPARCLELRRNARDMSGNNGSARKWRTS